MTRRRLIISGLALALVLAWAPSAQAASPAAPRDLQVGGLPGGRMRIAWTDTASNETYYQLERSTHNRQSYALLATLPAEANAYEDAAATPDITYWYRARACHDGGCSRYTKESFGVSFAAGAVPNEDERYALFLVNESRADPGAYGYPQYAPLPPVAANPVMQWAAHSHAQAILNSNFQIGHCYPDPPGSQPDVEFRCPSERARDAGYRGSLSENLVAGDDGWEATRGAHQAFMDSKGHRQNILDPGAKEAGLGHAYSPALGSAWPGQYTYTFNGANSIALPALPSGVVAPYWGRRSTAFSFLANFYDAGGSAPEEAQVVIDGVGHGMALRHGSAANGSYSYTSTLAPGAHSYYFAFRYGGGRWARLPAEGAFSGPDVEMGAAVLQVPEEYPTLAGALAHARGDVIVRLAAGVYNEVTPIGIPTPGVWIEGAGIDRTIIRGSGSGHVLIANVDALIRDLTITNSGPGHFEAGIWNTSGHVEVRNCRLTGNNVGLFSWCFEPTCDAVVTLTNSIVDHNRRAGVDSNEHAIHRLVNDTIVANGTGAYLNHPQSSLENSIVAQNSVGIAASRGPLLRYNDVWSNDQDYQGAAPGPGALAADPRFEDAATGDYRLGLGSPCLDTGNPEAAYNDRNGGRNDQGAYGGPLAAAVVNSRATAARWRKDTILVSWQGYAADGIASYDVQYGVGGGAWMDWLGQATAQSGTFGPRSPAAPDPKKVYCFRARARDRAGHVEDYPQMADVCAAGPGGEEVYLPVARRR